MKKKLDTYNSALDLIVLLGREIVKTNGDLDRLVRRFEKMADMRMNHAETIRLRRNHSDESAACEGDVFDAEVIESVASAYRRCANELRRFANGEEPPDPGYRWD